MGTKVTVLIDNTSSENLKGEWGLSFLVKKDDKKILVDTGSSDLFFKNSKLLNEDISDVDAAILSHAHADHSTGMDIFFKENKKAKFYLQKDALENCYFKKLFFKAYIGLPKGILKEYENRITQIFGDYKLYDGIYIVSHKTPNLSLLGKREMMMRYVDKKWIHDDFSHEQSLVIETEKGLVIINSCCHGGVVNIIREVKETFPDKKIAGIIGGFHLYNKSKKEILKVAKEIEETGISFVATGHCTKDRAYRILSTVLKAKLIKFHVGLTMEF